MTTGDDVAPGTVLAGKYEVERVLGRGGMGVVVAARHMQLGSRVALKFLLPTVLDSPDHVKRFLREAQAASLIASEHVTRVLDVGTLETGAPFIVMEHLSGRDLASLLTSSGPLPITDAVDYVLQTCEALAVAHSAGIVHRDLKPANLFLTEAPDGSPLIKILDFGISKKQATEGEFALTRTGDSILGSPAYMSPEQIKSRRDLDGRADLWSLSVSLYEMLSGQIPFLADSLGGLIAAILSEAPPSLASRRPDVRPELEAVILACLQKQPSSRPANAAIWAQMLRPFASARGAASAERALGVVARTTGGLSPAAVVLPIGNVASTSTGPQAAPPEISTTRRLGSSASFPAAGPLPSGPVAPPPSAAPADAPDALARDVPSGAVRNAPPVHAPFDAGRASHPSLPATPPIAPASQPPLPTSTSGQISGAWAPTTGPIEPPRRGLGPIVAVLATLLAAVVGVAIYFAARRRPEAEGAVATAGASTSAPVTTTLVTTESPATSAAELAPSASPAPPSGATTATTSTSSASATSAAGKPTAAPRPTSSTKPASSKSDLNKLIQNRK